MKRTFRPAAVLSALVALFATGGGCKAPAEPAAGPEQAPRAADLVQLSAEAVARSGIQVATVASHSLGDSIEAPAEVQLNPDRVAHVEPLVAGQLQRVDVSIGDRVQRDQVLAVLRSVELGQARAENGRAEAILAAARSNFARQERLRTEGISSERSFLEAQLQRAEAEAGRDAAHARLLVFGLSGGGGPDMPVTAPISGTIVERHATRGENVGPEKELFVIADTTKVWVVARVYEQDMSKVLVGASARLVLQAQPKRSWQGQVSFVSPVVDEATRTLAVRLELANEDGSLRPGLFGRLRIAVGEAQPVAAVPEDALQTLHGATVVFVPAGAPNAFRAQKVTAGRRSGELVEVREGLAVGSQVVVAGAFLLKSQLLSAEFGEQEAP
jgi:cobalt-zinc-cadmium efflux system membrane fusion protein